jgi:hypothetical protein
MLFLTSVIYTDHIKTAMAEKITQAVIHIVMKENIVVAIPATLERIQPAMPIPARKRYTASIKIRKDEIPIQSRLLGGLDEWTIQRKRGHEREQTHE